MIPSELELRCEDARASVSELIDRELEASRAAGVKRHLRACKPCARYCAELSRVVRALRGLSLGRSVCAWLDVDRADGASRST